MRTFISLALIAGAAGMAHGQIVIYSTDGNVTGVSNGSNDPFAAGYNFSLADSGSAVVAQGGTASGWITELPGNPNDAQWIGLTSTYYQNGSTAAYSDAFQVSSAIADASLTISLSVDDQLGDGSNAGMYLDGTAIAGSSTGILWNGTVLTETLDLGALSAGTHHLEFNDYNIGNGPSGLIYSGTIQSVPEPISMTLLGIGAAALLRRKRSA